jgi:hypothetical protein
MGAGIMLYIEKGKKISLEQFVEWQVERMGGGGRFQVPAKQLITISREVADEMLSPKMIQEPGLRMAW